MLISVIIPTYKPQSYLWECLDSLCAQSFSNSEFEVVLVLNGCCEPWNGEIQKYIHEHPELRVKYVQTDQPGVSNARNLALDLSEGEYVTFVDDDDYVSPSYLEELYSKSAPDTIGLSYAYAFNDGDSSAQLKYGITDVYDKLFDLGKQPYPRSRKYFSGPCMKLIPMSFIQDRRFDVRFKNGEDSIYMFLISDKFKFVDFTSREAIYYRRYRNNSAVTTKRSISYILGNSLKRLWAYCRIYMSNPFGYSFCVFSSRLLATGKGCVYMIMHSLK